MQAMLPTAPFVMAMIWQGFYDAGLAWPRLNAYIYAFCVVTVRIVIRKKRNSKVKERFFQLILNNLCQHTFKVFDIHEIKI